MTPARPSSARESPAAGFVFHDMADDMIVFYDAECGFCSGLVQYLLRQESASAVRFAPLGGETATRAGISTELGRKTIVVLEDGKTYVRSRAVRRVMDRLKGPWAGVSKAMGIIPTPLVDVGYRVVATIRRRLPSSSSCRLPTPQERSRFLP